MRRSVITVLCVLFKLFIYTWDPKQWTDGEVECENCLFFKFLYMRNSYCQFYENAIHLISSCQVTSFPSIIMTESGNFSVLVSPPNIWTWIAYLKVYFWVIGWLSVALKTKTANLNDNYDVFLKILRKSTQVYSFSLN